MAEEKRYCYLVGCFCTPLGGLSVFRVPLTTPFPVQSMDEVAALEQFAADFVAGEHPGWDASYPGWRQSVKVTGFSLMRVEVLRDGEWVLAEHQPWGRG